MEGKEVRFGVPTRRRSPRPPRCTSTGAVNSFHDSYTPLGGMMPMVNMMLGEVAPGGVGSGLYGMLILAVITVFVAGLMVGRTPGVPGQEDRRPGDEARRAVLPGHPRARAGRHRRSRCATGNNATAAQHAARTASPRCCTPSPRRQQQRLARSPASRVTRRGGTPRSAWPCCSAGSCRSSWSWPWPARWPGSSPMPESAGTLPTHQPLFVGLLVGVDRRPGRAHLPPRSRPRPPRGGPLMTTPARPPSRDPRRCRPAASRAGLLDPAQLWRSLPGRRCASSTRAPCGATR